MDQLSVTIFSNTTYELHYWIQGFEVLAKTKELGQLRFAGGMRAPLSNEEKGWGSLLFDVTDGNRTVHCYMDIRDGYEQINRRALEFADLYFKVNCNRLHLQETLPPSLVAKIRPAGSWFAVQRDGWENPFSILLRSTWTALTAQPISDVNQLVASVKWLPRFNIAIRKFPRMEYLTQSLHGTPKTQDVIFKPRAWRSELKQVTARRLALMEIIDRIAVDFPDRSFANGFLDSEIARESFPERILQTANSRSEYLRDLAATRIGVVTRGLKGSLNCSIGEHLAVGTCMFLERPVNNIWVDLEDGVNVVLFDPDLGDFDEKMRYYLEHPEECDRIASNGLRYFHEIYCPAGQARHMITEAATILRCGVPNGDESGEIQKRS